MTVNHEVIGFAQNWRAEKALKTLGFQGFLLILEKHLKQLLT